MLLIKWTKRSAVNSNEIRITKNEPAYSGLVASMSRVGDVLFSVEKKKFSLVAANRLTMRYIIYVLDAEYME